MGERKGSCRHSVPEEERSMKEIILKVAVDGKEIVLCAENEKQAEALRTSGFRKKRLMSDTLVKGISFQKFSQDGKWFLRVYKQKLTLCEKDPRTGAYIPAQDFINSENRSDEK